MSKDMGAIEYKVTYITCQTCVYNSLSFLQTSPFALYFPKFKLNIVRMTTAVMVNHFLSMTYKYI